MAGRKPKVVINKYSKFLYWSLHDKIERIKKKYNITVDTNVVILVCFKGGRELTRKHLQDNGVPVAVAPKVLRVIELLAKF